MLLKIIFIIIIFKYLQCKFNKEKFIIDDFSKELNNNTKKFRSDIKKKQDIYNKELKKKNNL